ncbi:class I SAM-dependent methyltransferase [Patescibacteria group bacterium]
MKNEKQINEENPFETKSVSKEWITSVEGEVGLIRDNEIYPRLQSWISEIKPNIVVEIGSGQGICSNKLGDFDGKYIGIEPSKYLTERAKELYNSQANKTFKIGNAYDLPFNDNEVDAVFSVMVWFHLENLEKASKEIFRILKTGAKFYIITANPDLYNVWESFFLDYEKKDKKLIGRVKVPISSLSKNIIHLHTTNEIITSLKKAGLNIESIEKFGAGKENSDEGLMIGIVGSK